MINIQGLCFGFILLAGGPEIQLRPKEAPGGSVLDRYRAARHKLLLMCQADKQDVALSLLTEGTFVDLRSGKPELVIIADRTPSDGTCLHDALRRLTKNSSLSAELRGVDYRVHLLSPPSTTGWAPASELPRYHKARELLLDYAFNQAGTDSDAPLLLLTRGTYVRQDPVRGVKLMVVTRPPGPQAPDYSGLDIQHVLAFITSENSALVGLRGIQYEIRYLPKTPV